MVFSRSPLYCGAWRTTQTTAPLGLIGLGEQRDLALTDFIWQARTQSRVRGHHKIQNRASVVMVKWVY